MSDAPPDDLQSQGVDRVQRTVVVVVVLLIILGLGFVAAAVALASNPSSTGPSVRIIRDLLIIVMTLEILVIGAAFVVFLIQLARLVNMIHNEVTPLIEAASETVNTVRGTAAFLSKNLVEPVTAVNSTLRGVSKVVGDVDAIRKAAGIVMSAANESSSIGMAGDDPQTSDGARSIDSQRSRRRGVSAQGVASKRPHKRQLKKER